MTPAERLRAAAGRLEELDKAATPGPWRVSPEHVRGLNCLLAERVRLVASADDRRSRPDFDLIAALRPLAPVLANQLRHAGLQAQNLYTDPISHRTWHEDGCGMSLDLFADEPECRCFTPALDIADAVLAATGGAL